jgi:hypothetical protein
MDVQELRFFYTVVNGALKNSDITRGERNHFLLHVLEHGAKTFRFDQNCLVIAIFKLVLDTAQEDRVMTATKRPQLDVRYTKCSFFADYPFQSLAEVVRQHSFCLKPSKDAFLVWKTTRKKWINIPDRECKDRTESTFSENKVDGEVPETIYNHQNLQALFLNDNMLTGSIAAGSIAACIASLTSFKLFFVFKNRLTGEVPSALSELWQLSK